MKRPRGRPRRKKEGHWNALEKQARWEESCGISGWSMCWRLDRRGYTYAYCSPTAFAAEFQKYCACKKKNSTSKANLCKSNLWKKGAQCRNTYSQQWCQSWSISARKVSAENAPETMEPAGFALTLTAGNGQLKTTIIFFPRQGATQKKFTDAKTQYARPSAACDQALYHPKTTTCIQILSEATAADNVWWMTWKVLGFLTKLQWVLPGFATKERLQATGSSPMSKLELH